MEPKKKKLGRNDPCHCGSGKKYKKCHLSLDSRASIDPLSQSDEEHRHHPLSEGPSHESPEKPSPSHLGSSDIRKGHPVTPSEAYLAKLAGRTFLSLWSYSGIHRDQGKSGAKGIGKELCDLLVVFGKHVLVFSDKYCNFQTDKPLPLAWSRWFRSAIADSARQAQGAARWILEHPERLYLDSECTRRFPLEIPRKELKVHLIVVGQGISQHVASHFGDSGSLMIRSYLRGVDAHTDPFVVGDLDPTRPFVHVLDDESLTTLMESRDTVSDFVEYLVKREALLRGPVNISSTGEEELLAIYLTKMNTHGEHDFVFSSGEGEAPSAIFLDQGHWRAFQESALRKRQREEDRISYLWDSAIESFAKHAMVGTQHFVTPGGFSDSERILRFMAAEPRFKRRQFAADLERMLTTTPGDHRRVRVIIPEDPGLPYYVFLLLPAPTEEGGYEEYRVMRREHLAACCIVTRLWNPKAHHIVGIATETGPPGIPRSEDLCYVDGSHWTSEAEDEARRLQQEFEILLNPTVDQELVQEYPGSRITTPARVGRHPERPR